MTSTSKSGMVVTSSIRVVEPLRMLDEEPVISNWLALKIGAVCALVPLLLWLAGMMWRMK